MKISAGKKVAISWLAGLIISLSIGIGLTAYVNADVHSQLTDSRLQKILSEDVGYTSYAEALQKGEFNRILSATNGLAFKTSIWGSTHYWVFGYDWIAGDKSPEAIQKYINENTVLMFIRGFVLSDRTMAGAVLGLFLGFIGLYLQKSISYFYVWLYSWFKLYRVQRKRGEKLQFKFLKPVSILMDMRIKEDWKVGIVTALFAFIVAYTGVINHADMLALSVVGILYIVLLYLIGFVQMLEVLSDIKGTEKRYK